MNVAQHESFTMEDAMRMLNISHDALIELLQTGKLRGKRLSYGGWMIEAQSVMEYLNNGQR